MHFYHAGIRDCRSWWKLCWKKIYVKENIHVYKFQICWTNSIWERNTEHHFPNKHQYKNILKHFVQNLTSKIGNVFCRSTFCKHSFAFGDIYRGFRRRSRLLRSGNHLERIRLKGRKFPRATVANRHAREISYSLTRLYAPHNGTLVISRIHEHRGALVKSTKVGRKWISRSYFTARLLNPLIHLCGETRNLTLPDIQKLRRKVLL